MLNMANTSSWICCHDVFNRNDGIQFTSLCLLSQQQWEMWAKRQEERRKVNRSWVLTQTEHVFKLIFCTWWPKWEYVKIWNLHRPFSWNKRLKPPLVLLWVKGQSVHDLILLLWRDEVLYDQIPACSPHTAVQKLINILSGQKWG